MFRQYFKQAIQILKENRLTSVISILGTALSIAMILVVILQFQIKLVGFRPESNRDRMLYIMGIGQIHGIVNPGIRPPCPMVS